MEENEEIKINFVPCITWVKKGVAKANPERIQLQKDELVRIINDTKQNLRISDSTENASTSQAGNSGVQRQANEESYNLENYDNEDDINPAQLLGIDAVVDIQGNADDHFSDLEDSDAEDEIIKPEDNLILVGRVEGDASLLEIYIYNEVEESLYVHHDIVLPDLPLCIEWLDHEVNQPAGNYCAIGMMSPIIEIWDLDIVNCLEPAYRLGRKGSKKKRIQHIGHRDAVLDLSWNKNYDHILASGSVDKTILVWDLDQGEPATNIKAFSDKVQCLEWHKLEAQTLLAGSADKTVKVFDCRTPESHQTWHIMGEAERVAWNPLEPFSFYTSTDNGFVQYFDVRRGEVFKIKAHEKEVTGLAVSAQCPGLFVTASQDELVKIWDHTQGQEPTMVYQKSFEIGLVHSLALCSDLPFVIASGGDNKKKNFSVFDLQNIDTVKRHFESRPLVQLVTSEDAEMESNNQ